MTEEEFVSGDTLVRLSGDQQSFRCSCGSNVFRKLLEGHEDFDPRPGFVTYRCNGCRAIWHGEREESTKPEAVPDVTIVQVDDFSSKEGENWV
jgi:hypothetical protein